MDLTRAFVEAKVSCKEMSDSCQELTHSCKELANSYKSLEIMAADLLSTWERFKIQQATTISSPSTATTPPPTAPVPPAATSEEALANIGSAMDRPLKLHAVPELSMPAPAKCSTECQDMVSQKCEAASANLARTNTFTSREKTTVLAATSTVIARSVSLTEVDHATTVQGLGVVLASKLLSMCLKKSVYGEASVPAPAACVPVAAIHVSPCPPDLHVQAHEGYDAIVVMVPSARVPPRPPDWCCTTQEQGASLPPSVPLPVLVVAASANAPSRSVQTWSASRLPDETHGTPFASQVTLALHTRYERGVFNKIFAERVSMIVACVHYAETMQSNVNSRELLDTYHHKLNGIVLCWNVGLLIMPSPEANDVNELELLCWKLQASTFCHRIQWIAKNHYRIMPCIVPFFMIWDPGIMECFMGVPYYPGNTIGVFPSVCRATVVQQYMNSSHLNSLASYTERQCTTPSLVQLRNFISGSHQFAVEVGLSTSKYFCCLELSVKPKVEINGVTILWVELHVHSTCVWVSFPWNPGLHTWLWCCCRMHDRQVHNSVYGYDLLEQSCTGSSWPVEAWTDALQNIQYDAKVVNPIAEEMLLCSWIKFNGNSLIEQEKGKGCL